MFTRSHWRNFMSLHDDLDKKKWKLLDDDDDNDNTLGSKKNIWDDNDKEDSWNDVDSDDDDLSDLDDFE